MKIFSNKLLIFVCVCVCVCDGSIYLCMMSFSCRTGIITKYQNKLIQDVDLTIASYITRPIKKYLCI